MVIKNVILQARKTPNRNGYKGKHLVHQITIPKKIIKETGWKKGEKINISANGDKAIFQRGLPNNADEKKIETLERGLRNLSEHENLAPRLLKIEKSIDKIEDTSLFNFISLMIIVILLLVFGGMLL